MEAKSPGKMIDYDLSKLNPIEAGFILLSLNSIEWLLEKDWFP